MYKFLKVENVFSLIFFLASIQALKREQKIAKQLQKFDRMLSDFSEKGMLLRISEAIASDIYDKDDLEKELEQLNMTFSKTNPLKPLPEVITK